MIALIDVKNVSTKMRNGQSIGVSNAIKQRVDVAPIPPQKIEISDANDSAGGIEITHLWHIAKMREFEIALDTKVPKSLSILPQVNSDELSTPTAREGSKVYLQVGETPSFATLEQIKQLNTKTVFVDELSDTQVHHLSNEDIVMLKKE